MQNIEIDREMKLKLLKWLKQGYIDNFELLSLVKQHPISDDELDAELDRLMKKIHRDEGCSRFERLGLCPYAARPVKGGKRGRH